MLFLRGTSDHPVCLDSKKVMDILFNYPQVMDELEFFDLTKDKDIEGNLKQYSNYGDVPQLYINFQLLGGVEIIEALDQSGELVKILGPKVKRKRGYKISEGIQQLLSPK